MGFNKHAHILTVCAQGMYDLAILFCSWINDEHILHHFVIIRALHDQIHITVATVTSIVLSIKLDPGKQSIRQHLCWQPHETSQKTSPNTHLPLPKKRLCGSSWRASRGGG
jgi:hypothetical protein